MLCIYFILRFIQCSEHQDLTILAVDYSSQNDGKKIYNDNVASLLTRQSIDIFDIHTVTLLKQQFFSEATIHWFPFIKSVERLEDYK